MKFRRWRGNAIDIPQICRVRRPKFRRWHGKVIDTPQICGLGQNTNVVDMKCIRSLTFFARFPISIVLIIAGRHSIGRNFAQKSTKMLADALNTGSKILADFARSSL